MPNDTAEDRRRKNQRDPQRDSCSSQPAPAPINPPLMIDGPELVRDSHC